MGAVVDGSIGADGKGFRQLFIATGGNNHPGSRQFSELQRKDRHAASAEGQNCLAGHQAAGGEGVPGGEAGTGQGGTLGITQVIGHFH
jgi:hypothetical protein